jgi:FMN phosphatase YigB (HAD superfamily)
MKLLLQKRINNDALVRKSPRMYYYIGLQWELSGNQVVYFGDDILILIMGNRKFGNELVRIRENLLDLSLKVNYIYKPFFLIIGGKYEK